jgi:hypothetical protein
MQKISRSNLKFVRLIRHLRDHAGLDVHQAVKVSVEGSCDVYVRVDMGTNMMPLTKDVNDIYQLSLVLEKLGM